MNKQKGFVYVATGIGYISEAIVSAKQLKKIHPEYRICLISDSTDIPHSDFDDFILLENKSISHSPIDKAFCTLCPYTEAIFLDTDTWASNRIDELFDILKSFHLALLPEVKRGWYYTLPEVPRTFSEFNTGVIAFRNTNEVKELFEKWKVVYWELRKEQNLKGNQASFRKVIWESPLRIAPLPSEFHFLTNAPN